MMLVSYKKERQSFEYMYTRDSVRVFIQSGYTKRFDYRAGIPFR